MRRLRLQVRGGAPSLIPRLLPGADFAPESGEMPAGQRGLSIPITRIINNKFNKFNKLKSPVLTEEGDSEELKQTPPALTRHLPQLRGGAPSLIPRYITNKE